VVDKVKQGVDLREQVKHVERNDELLVTRMRQVNEQEEPEMKNDCCEEPDDYEQRRVHAHTKVGRLSERSTLYPSHHVLGT